MRGLEAVRLVRSPGPVAGRLPERHRLPEVMTTSPQLTWQPSLLDSHDETAIDEAFSTLERIGLDATSWVEYAPGWLSGSDGLFSELVERTDWQQRTRHMYDRKLQEPRLTAGWSAASGRALEPAVLEAIRRALSARYGVTFDSVGLNLYRDGRDSVAWHRDRIAKEIADPIVALVSIGEPRRFLLRPAGGRAARTFMLGRGDLLVTGGSCQRAWEHAVPKVARAGPRISIAYRHGFDAGVRYPVT
jgi:alkylated DNA repair dioxygenase AlkB